MIGRYFTIVLLVVIVVFAKAARATMIVVIFTEEGYWIGSDSYRSDADGHTLVCKIHETRLGILAKGGNSRGETEYGELYSTDKEVEDLVATSSSISIFKEQLARRFKEDIAKEMSLVIDDPMVRFFNLGAFEMTSPFPEKVIIRTSRTAILFDTHKVGDLGQVLIVQPHTERTLDQSNYVAYRYSAKSIYDWLPVELVPRPPTKAVVLAQSIRQFVYVVSYDKSDAWVKEHPEQAVRELLEKGHAERPNYIGPPYSIVHVVFRTPALPSIKWISSGTCPGWAESFDSKNTLMQGRDELRKSKR